MPHPSWDDPIATAHAEAAMRLPRGLPVRPTLIGFEGTEPTLYVRSRLPEDRSDLDVAIPELLLLPRMLGIGRLMLVSQVTMTDARDATDATDPSDPASDVDAAVRRALFADRGIIVERVQRDDRGGIDSSGDVLPYRIDDHGRCCWDDPIALTDGGPWSAVVDHQLSSGDVDGRPDSLGPTGAAYALSRFGVTIAVAPTWRARYGFDGSVDHRGVRREDRRRARDHEARRSRSTAAEVHP